MWSPDRQIYFTPSMAGGGPNKKPDQKFNKPEKGRKPPKKKIETKTPEKKTFVQITQSLQEELTRIRDILEKKNLTKEEKQKLNKECLGLFHICLPFCYLPVCCSSDFQKINTEIINLINKLEAWFPSSSPQKPEETPEEKKKIDKTKNQAEKSPITTLETIKITPGKIKKHFYEELEKIKNHPISTGRLKRKFYKEATGLLWDWLPFGHLDDFQGIKEIMNLIEKNKPKFSLTYNYRKEKLAEQITYEMAFQYPLWKSSPEKKTHIIIDFVDTWLKKKSFYYQQAKEFQRYLTKPPKKYLKHRAKYGYFAGETIEEPTKAEKWLTKEIATLLKLLGRRDKTLSKACEILAAENISYLKGIKELHQKIENKNIQAKITKKLLKIEESTDKEKIELLWQLRKELGVSPELPLKIEFYKEYIKYLKTKDPQLAEVAEILLGELNERKNQIQNQQKIKALQKNIQKTIQKNKNIPSPKALTKVKDHLEKKGASLADFAGLFGFSFLLFIVLILLGEIKLGEKLTGIKVENLGK